MNRSLIISLVCIGIFIAGGVSGVLGTQRYYEMKREARRANADTFGPNQMQRFTKALDLSQEQRAHIQPILSQTADELRKLRRESWLASAALLRRMEAGINEQLTSEQQKQFATMQAEQRERIRQRMPDAKRRGETGQNRDSRPPATPPPPASAR